MRTLPSLCLSRRRFSRVSGGFAIEGISKQSVFSCKSFVFYCRYLLGENLYKLSVLIYNTYMKIILASGSPRRKELLEKIRADFSVVPAVRAEVSCALSPSDKVKELAGRKAAEVYKKQTEECCVIGCDTVVEADGQVLGKPKDEKDARRMLGMLSGRSHYVHTGVCIVSPVKVSLFSETTEVFFRTLTDKEIAAYIAGGSPMDKAGAYGIQDCGFVQAVKGSYFNVMGLPLERLEKELEKFFDRG